MFSNFDYYCNLKDKFKTPEKTMPLKSQLSFTKASYILYLSTINIIKTIFKFYFKNWPKINFFIQVFQTDSP